MRSTLRALVGFVCVALLIGIPALAATPSGKSNDDDAAKLVRAALESELAGNVAERAQNLHDAIEASPNYAPARWHSGQIQWNEAWLPVDEVSRRLGGDERLVAYRQKRDALVDTADHQRELARWCDKQQLKDQARVHWTKVLEFEPVDAEALVALKLKWHEGRLLTRSQIDREQRVAGERQRAMREWQPRAAKWRAAFAGSNPSQRDAARAQLMALQDPAAIPALEIVFGIDGSSQQVTDLNQLLIQALDRIPDRAATAALLRRAVLSDSQPARIAAARSLSKRPPNTYLPQLIAALPPNEEVTTRNQFAFTHDGSFYRLHEVQIRDRDSGEERSLVLRDFDLPIADVVYNLRVGRVERRLLNFTRDVARSEQQISRSQREVEDLRQRLELALRESTGSYEQRTAAQWHEKLDEMTETYSPPKFETPEANWPQSDHIEYTQVRYTASCFPRDTPVLTANGLVAIEQIRPGDQVVAQNVATGEVALQAVQQVTLRPAAPMIEIGVGDNAIRATRGHPFWVNGEGWQMAKHLTVGQRLHTLDGPMTIDRLENQPGQEAYNLVVNYFGTYFVGESRVLVHDNQPIAETAALVPGLLARDIQP